MVLQAESVSLTQIEAAAQRIRPYVSSTPLIPGDALGYDGLWLKAESLQRTGSFKIRGALNALIQLGPQERRRGVITLSAGNHGQALAYAAQRFGIPCVVVVRDDAPRNKLDAIRRYGAELVLVPIDAWQRRLEEEQSRRGSYLVHPFDDPAVINGQGTVGLEIVETLPEVGSVVVPVGGGGLISGVARAIKARQPDARVIGIEPEGASVVSQSLAAGHPVPLERIDTVADGLAPPYTRPLNLALVKALVDEVRTVSDAAIIDALRMIASRSRLIVEPAGAAAVAGLASLDLKLPAVAILTGGNMDQYQLGRWLSVQ